LVVKGDVNVNAKDGLGKTALIVACESSPENIVSLLLTRYIIYVDVVDNGRKMALDWAP
jgi:ankyrin repeat protein